MICILQASKTLQKLIKDPKDSGEPSGVVPLEVVTNPLLSQVKKLTTSLSDVEVNIFTSCTIIVNVDMIHYKVRSVILVELKLKPKKYF